MPSAAAIATWLSALTARFRSAAAAFSLATLVPLRARLTRGTMPPAAAINDLMSTLTARFQSAAAAFSLATL
eukprot:6107691-Pleurochrysis_carterae.AAC.1